MACRECFDVYKVCMVFILIRNLYSGILLGKTPSHKFQQRNCILWGLVMKFQLHRPLFKQLRHALLQIVQWNKQPSGMTIDQVVYSTEESQYCVSYLYKLSIRVLYYKMTGRQYQSKELCTMHSSALLQFAFTTYCSINLLSRN